MIVKYSNARAHTQIANHSNFATSGNRQCLQGPTHYPTPFKITNSARPGRQSLVGGSGRNYVEVHVYESVVWLETVYDTVAATVSK